MGRHSTPLPIQCPDLHAKQNCRKGGSFEWSYGGQFSWLKFITLKYGYFAGSAFQIISLGTDILDIGLTGIG